MSERSRLTVYLSKPAVLCVAGASPEEAIAAVCAGNTDGIVQTECCGKQFCAGHIDDSLLKPVSDKYDSRMLRILNAALDQIAPAVENVCRLYGRDRIGVCLGSCDNGSEQSLAAHRAFFDSGAFPGGYSLAAQSAAYPAAFASKKFGVSGISLAFSTACASSASALMKARELIRAGACDAVIAGGVDIASPTVLLGFDALASVSPERTNPFSKNRNGITLGEGAAFFVLSKDDTDGSGIILAGCGESSDASHMTAPLADGSGAERAMRSALADAALAPGDIGYINLHGTGTVLNDRMEALAVHRIFGGEMPVSSTKPMTGHTLGAAGALELALCHMSVGNTVLPVHCWDGSYDPELPRLQFVRQGQAVSPVHCCMSNSFAFGGCNVSLILKTEKDMHI